MTAEADSPDPGEVVRRHVDAFNAQDLDGLLACFTDDVTWVTGSDSFRGTAALLALFTGAFRDFSPRLHVPSILVDGSSVACELREDFVVEGVERTDYVAGFYRVVSGLIAGAKIYREGSADI